MALQGGHVKAIRTYRNLLQRIPESERGYLFKLLASHPIQLELLDQVLKDEYSEAVEEFRKIVLF